jgi:hypothetical protein
LIKISLSLAHLVAWFYLRILLRGPKYHPSDDRGVHAGRIEHHEELLKQNEEDHTKLVNKASMHRQEANSRHPLNPIGIGHRVAAFSRDKGAASVSRETAKRKEALTRHHEELEKLGGSKAGTSSEEPLEEEQK